MESADRAKWIAVQQRNRQWDGKFVYAVITTGVYCRPACPARSPKRQNVQFFDEPVQARQAGFRACRRCKPDATNHANIQLVESIQSYINENLDRTIPLKELAAHTGLSQFHLQRVFKSETGVSPKQYADGRRMQLFKHEARSGRSLTDAIFEAGYSSSSRLYDRASVSLGMTPAAYRNKGAGVEIEWAFAECRLGSFLIAATKKGICFLQFGKHEGKMLEALQAEFPHAEITANNQSLQKWIDSFIQYLEEPERKLAVPVDLTGTAFQIMVWEYLRKIPVGETRTYSEVAAAIGKPRAVRAVANACASNQVAIAVPCHRVIREDGGLGGYRWGIARKRALLDLESL
ncbi:MAG TPA: bifunctional DNA-binding transcriptional regulator/O6-methylguanine-DNA methyltransferase Ada [Candidatus Obscuribacterales bacterium]